MSKKLACLCVGLNMLSGVLSVVGYGPIIPRRALGIKGKGHDGACFWSSICTIDSYDNKSGISTFPACVYHRLLSCPAEMRFLISSRIFFGV